MCINLSLRIAFVLREVLFCVVHQLQSNFGEKDLMPAAFACFPIEYERSFSYIVVSSYDEHAHIRRREHGREIVSAPAMFAVKVFMLTVRRVNMIYIYTKLVLVGWSILAVLSQISRAARLLPGFRCSLFAGDNFFFFLILSSR